MNLYNCITWIDPEQSVIFHFDTLLSDELVVHSKSHRHRFHHLTTHAALESHADSAHYFKLVAAAIDEICEIVICGPDVTKFEFANYLGKHEHSISEKVIAVERLVYANDVDILSIARRYFKVPRELVHISYIAGV
jgi:hypothetical protein